MSPDLTGNFVTMRLASYKHVISQWNHVIMGHVNVITKDGYNIFGKKSCYHNGQ